MLRESLREEEKEGRTYSYRATKINVIQATALRGREGDGGSRLHLGYEYDKQNGKDLSRGCKIFPKDTVHVCRACQPYFIAGRES